MSSFAYQNLAATLGPNMPQAAPVDEVMPLPETAPNSYLHELGKLLQDHQQTAGPQQQGPQSNNPYSANNAGNPYAIEGDSPLQSLSNKLGKETGDAAATSEKK